MVSLKTHRIATDDETLYHSAEISIGNKAIKTPIRTIEPKIITASLDLNPTVKGVNEIYKVLNEEKITQIIRERRKKALKAERDLSDIEESVRRMYYEHRGRVSR